MKLRKRKHDKWEEVSASRWGVTWWLTADKIAEAQRR